VGSDAPVTVDVRLISATNRDLRADVDRAAFRQDLYYRVRVFELRIPPLRERKADLPPLVEQFLREFTPSSSPLPTLTPAAWAALSRYEFPGNVRELRHAIQHGAILSKGAAIDVVHLPPDIRGESAATEREPMRLTLAVEQYEREHILRTLELAGGERNRAAEILGTSRKTLWKKMKKYGLSGFHRGPSRAA
jgi:DNA-binding NtrC family response regulator